MSVSIISGASSNVLTIDATSLAARVTLYDTAGIPLVDATRPGFVVPIFIRFSGAMTALNYIYCIRNGGARSLRIVRIFLGLAFDGTAAASTSRYRFERVTGVTATSGTGSTTLTPGRLDAALASSTVTEVRQADGSVNALTLSSGSIADNLFETGCQRQVNANVVYEFGNSAAGADPLIVAVGTGNCLAIKIVNAAVIGDSISGYIEFQEL